MKTFKSIYLDKGVFSLNMPDDSEIYNMLEFVGYSGFIPKTFIADLLIVSKYKLYQFVPVLNKSYLKSIYDIFEGTKIDFWVKDTMFVFKKISEKYNLKLLNNYASKGAEFNLDDISFSFNYSFNISDIDDSIMELLNITEEHILETEKLPDNIIDILTISSGYGNFLKSAKSFTVKDEQMQSYGDVFQIHKHRYADPLFDYKFAIKSYNLDKEDVILHKSKTLVVGYFLDSFVGSLEINTLLKLLGTLILLYSDSDISVIIYSFYGDSYSKEELQSKKDIIDYFSKDHQLRLFPIDNSKALRIMVSENKGNEVLYMPNIKNNCTIQSGMRSFCKVNIISLVKSNFNMQYSNICKQTNGIFLTI